MNIIGHKNLFLIISGLLILGSLTVIFFWGLKLGIDFTGGSLLEINFSGERPSPDKIQNELSQLGISSISVQPTGQNGFILRFKEIDEKTHQLILSKLAADNPGAGEISERNFNVIGPTIGRELRQKSLIAIALTLAAIILYITWAFRKVSRPVSSWKYGVAAILALAHDLIIPVGVFALLGHFKGVEIDTLFVTALLTILGFSVHDTIVVFDRIRESLKKSGDPRTFDAIVNKSINETIGRSINTSFTVLLVLGAIMAFGGRTTFYFALMLALGVFFGTYSSIFIASPILVIWNKISSSRRLN